MSAAFGRRIRRTAAAVLFLCCFQGRAFSQSSEFGKEAVQDLDEGLSKLRKERDKLMDEISHLKTEKLALCRRNASAHLKRWSPAPENSIKSWMRPMPR